MKLPPGLSLRAAEDRDSAALVALVAEAYAAYPGCVLLVDQEEPDLLCPGRAYAAPGGWWVVERDGTVIASVALSLSPKSELKKLYVSKTARGQGLGATLVRFAEQRALAAGVRELRLWTDTRFQEAHRLYERLGWHRQAMTRPLADASRTTEFEYRKRL